MKERYELVNCKKIIDTSEANGKSYYIWQLKALRSFKNEATGYQIEKGELGGYITKNAMSQEGTSWVESGSFVIGTQGQRLIEDGAYVANCSSVFNGRLTGKAYVSQSTVGVDEADAIEITDNARVFESTLGGSVWVGGQSELSRTDVRGAWRVSGYAHLNHCMVVNRRTQKDFPNDINVPNPDIKYYINDQRIENDFRIDDLEKLRAKESKKLEEVLSSLGGGNN